MTDQTPQTAEVWIRSGTTVSITVLNGIQGEVTYVDLAKRTIVVDLGDAGSWTGSADKVSVVVPPDLRHPAVIVVRKTDPERWTPFDSLDDVAARHVAAVLVWVLANIDFEKPATWLGDQADLVKASVTT